MKNAMLILIMVFGAGCATPDFNSGEFWNGFNQGFNNAGGINQRPVASEPIKQTDYACMTRCRNAGSSFGYCKSLCEY